MLSTANCPHRVRRVVPVKILCAGLLVSFAASVIAASSVTVAWNRSASTEIAGYRVYYGVASHTYTNKVDAGNATNVVIGGLSTGTVYYLAATAYDTAGLESDYSTEAAFTNITTLPPTIVLTSPTNGTPFTAPATIGLAASVAANGHAISKVQFYNGAALLGEDNAAPYSFAWANVSAGIYDLTARAIYDTIGLITSPAVRANVYSPPKPPNTPPAISAIEDQTLNTGTAFLSIPFTVGDAETAAADLTLSGSSSDSALLSASDIVFGGSGSNRVVTLTPEAGQIGEVEITLVVSDGSLTTSTNFLLVVVEGAQGGPGIVLISPVGSVDVGSTRRYVWTRDPAATRYELHVTRDGELFCDKWCDAHSLWTEPGTANVGAQVADHTQGTYQWRVRGWSAAGPGPWSSTEIFSVVILQPVVLLSPADRARIQERRPEFAWSQPSPAAAWFHLCINRNGSKCYDLWIEGTTNWMPAIDLPGGTYTWAVQAWTPAGLGPWSKTASFAAQPRLPGQIVLLSPKSSLSVAPTVRYNWMKDDAAVSYELYITKDGKVFSDQWLAATNLLADGTKTSLGVEVGDHDSGTYQWCVRGWNPDGLGPWSSSGSFSVAGSLKPLALLAPTNQATIHDRRPEFSWSQSSPPAAWFHLYLSRSGTNYFDVWIEGATNWIPAFDLSGGVYTWMVQTWNPSGTGVCSETASFTNQLAAPASIELLSPQDTVTASATQRYLWRADSAATRYELYVVRNGSVFLDRWYASTNSLVDRATGNFAVDVPGHSAGSYQWWVRGSSPEGVGPWSSSLTFTQ